MKRRDFLQASVIGGSLLWTPGLFAELLTLTPSSTEGPFYPDKLPLDTDNDLLVINDSLTPAVGEITHLTGRVLNASGEPVRNAFVEIWQCDHNGAYLHSGTSNKESQDRNFQGYGRFLTDSKGNYYFRTIKPVPYPGRTPHIHFGVSRAGARVLTTQLYVKGHPQNEKDGVLRGIRDPKAAASVLGDFQPVPNSKFGELAVNFDIVIGHTPQDPEDHPQKGIGKSERSQGRGRGPGSRRPDQQSGQRPPRPAQPE
jgi:protocatechuate 3,4-dioxygenase beta subunit